MAAQVLQTLMTVRAQDVIRLNGVTAVGAFAVVHELALLEGHLELLLVTVDLQQGRTQQAVRHDADERDEGDDAPHIPIGAAHIRIAGNPHDGQDVQDGKQHDHDGKRRLDLRRDQLRKQFAHNVPILSFDRRFGRFASANAYGPH